MSRHRVTVTVNGSDYDREVESNELLVDFIRGTVGLTGTHVGCDTSNCGACAVILDGKAVKSCTILAVQAKGRKIMTVEGLAGDEGLHPIQRAFREKHGLQCGYCTPGILMTAYWLLSENPHPTRDEIRKAISGNLCRCTGYAKIIDAIEYAAKTMNKGGNTAEASNEDIET